MQQRTIFISALIAFVVISAIFFSLHSTDEEEEIIIFISVDDVNISKINESQYVDFKNDSRLHNEIIVQLLNETHKKNTLGQPTKTTKTVFSKSHQEVYNDLNQAFFDESLQEMLTFYVEYKNEIYSLHLRKEPKFRG